MVEFLVSILVRTPFKLVIGELEGVPWWTLLSKDVILLVGPIVLLWICITIIRRHQEFSLQQNDKGKRFVVQLQ